MASVFTQQIGGEDSPDPVLGFGLTAANTIIFGGRLVWSKLAGSEAGYMTNSTYALASPSDVRCWGVANEYIDNSTPSGSAPVNNANNPGTAGVTMRFNCGIFAVAGDGTVLQAQLGLPVYLLHDGESAGYASTPITVTADSGGGAYPFVGYVAPNPNSATANPDPSLIPVRIGSVENTKNVPSMGYINDSTTHTAAFNAASRHMHKINPSGATFAYTLPPITQANDGMKIAVVNVSGGTTATVAAPTGSDAVAITTGSTGATAVGPVGGAVKVYTADNTLKQWFTGI